MKIGILSDSHDRLPALAAAVKLLVEQRVEVILHAGDFIAPFAAKLLLPPHVPASIPVHCCYGNNDGERAGLKKVLPQVIDGPVRLTLGGPRKRVIVMHHFIDWLSETDKCGADVILTGHTHEIVNAPGILPDGKQALFLNPGECCGYLTGRCTCAILETDSLKATILDIPASTEATGG